MVTMVAGVDGVGVVLPWIEVTNVAKTMTFAGIEPLLGAPVL